VFRKKQKAFETNIINVGVEGFFYSNDGSTEIDDLITLAEGNYSELISSLKLKSNEEELDRSRVAELIAHLEVRTRHIRNSFLESGSELVDEILKLFADEEFISEYLIDLVNREPQIIENALSEEFKALGVSRVDQENLIRIMKPHMTNSLLNVVGQSSSFIEKMREQATGKLKAAVKDGHLRALNRTIEPESKVGIYSGLNYQIELASGKPFILGDSAVLFVVDSSRPYRAFYEKKDKLLAVLLPLSSSSCLVGRTEGSDFVVEDINSAIASCSLEYFIASENTEFNQKLAGKIGMNSMLLQKEEIRSIVDSALP